MATFQKALITATQLAGAHAVVLPSGTRVIVLQLTTRIKLCGSEVSDQAAIAGC
jgi:hypothetical protein